MIGKWHSKKWQSPRSRDIKIAVGIFLVSSLYFLTYANHGMNIWDEGVPLNGALRMFDGDRPIRDFTSYPPGRYFLYFFAMKIGGINVQSPRIAIAILSGAFSALIWIMGRRVGLKKSSIIPPFLFLLTPMYYYYRFFSFSLILLAFSLDLQLKPLSLWKAIASGLSAATIIWLRSELGLVVLVLLPIAASYSYLKKMEKRIVLNILPSGLMLAGQVFEIYYVGGFRSWLAYLTLAKSNLIGGLTEMSLPWPPLWSITYLSETAFFYLFQDSLFYICAAFILFYGYLSLRKPIADDPTPFVIWLTGSIGFGLVVWRTGFGNLLRSLPPITILAVYVFNKRSKLIKLKYLMGIIIGILLLVDSLFYNSQDYQSIGIIRDSNSKFSHPRFSAFTHRADCLMFSSVISTLESLKASEASSMIALPFHPIFNFVTGLKNHSYFEWLLPGMLSDRRFYDQMISNLIHSEPDLVLLNDLEFDGMKTRRFSNQFPEIMLWLARDYFFSQEVYQIGFFRKKTENSVFLLREDIAKIIKVGGSNQIELIHLEESDLRYLEQKNHSSITMLVNLEGANAFYAVLKARGSQLGKNVDVSVSLTINQIPIGSCLLTELNRSTHFLVELPDDIMGSVEMTLDCIWRSSDLIESVIWLEPVIMKLTDQGFIVDRYCYDS